MQEAALFLPYIDPVFLEIGPLSLRWYALAYIAGSFLAVWYMSFLTAYDRGGPFTRQVFWDAWTPGMIGLVLGGRLGYVLFYNLPYFLSNPLKIFAVWEGGMSFHGGTLGLIVGLYLFCRKRNLPPLAFANYAAAGVPIGLFFGRLANFINGELWGRPTDSFLGVVFYNDPTQTPRHASQLYEAGLEGLLLFVVLYVLVRRGALHYPGVLLGLNLAGYGLGRFFAEFFRAPDDHIGFLPLGFTMGQVLTVPFLLAGLAMVYFTYVRVKIRPKT